MRVCKRPAYGLNDAPRRWWNSLDSALRGYGLVPTRADRGCYVFHSRKEKTTKPGSPGTVSFDVSDGIEQAIESLTDPITCSPSGGTTVSGIICLHVDDLFCVGAQEFYQCIISSIHKDFQIGSEDTNDVLFVGQRVCWNTAGSISCIQVVQEQCIEELGEIELRKVWPTQISAQQHCIRNTGASWDT